MDIGLFVLLLLLPSIALTVYWIWMLVDAIRMPDDSYRSGTKLIWVLAIVLTGWIGAIVYQVVGRPRPA